MSLSDCTHTTTGGGGTQQSSMSVVRRAASDLVSSTIKSAKQAATAAAKSAASEDDEAVDTEVEASGSDTAGSEHKLCSSAFTLPILFCRHDLLRLHHRFPPDSIRFRRLGMASQGTIKECSRRQRCALGP